MLEKQTRREVIKKAAYVVPTVLTLAAKPSLACTGSKVPEYEKKGKFQRFSEPKEKEKPKFGKINFGKSNSGKNNFGKSFARGKKK
jgi:hypothetical protein